MIQSVQELPLILPTNTSDITFSNDELRTRSATCSGWLNHTEGTSQFTILGNGNLISFFVLVEFEFHFSNSFGICGFGVFLAIDIKCYFLICQWISIRIH